MSGLLALTLLAAAAVDPALPETAPQPAPVTQEDAEILVMARKLDEVTLTISRDRRGRLSCSAVRSSGHARLDARLCRATVQCIGKGDWAEESVKQCVEGRKPALIAEMRDKLNQRRAREAALRQGGGA